MCDPFLKWAGGKRDLLNELLEHVPNNFGRYFEPFLGGGALFFHLADTIGFYAGAIGDMNPHLVNAYEVVRDSPEELMEALSERKRAHGEEFYYTVREKFDVGDDVVRAANFIYLNKTGYNGLWRTNREGRMNTPFGRFKNPGIYDYDNIMECSKALMGVRVMANSFAVTVQDAIPDDFVYFDPPYVPLSETADFTSYTADKFGLLQQTQLRDCALDLKRRGVRVLISNSDSPAVRQLYRNRDYGFEMRRIEAKRRINSNAALRAPVGELLIW